jgi:two-component system, OmpR family, sensor kinase
VSRLPIRVRLTAAFATAMVVVLAAAGLFVYLRLKDDLDESIAMGLNTRVAAVADSGSAATGAAGDAEEDFAQLLTRDGSVVDSSGGLRGEALSPAELQRASSGEELSFERRLPGIEGSASVLARAGPGDRVVVAGQSLDDRDETLAGVVTSFAIGGPIAVALASLLGYGLAAAGARARSRSRAGTSGCRCPRPRTRSAGSARRSTRCSIGSAAHSSASAAS